MFVSIYRVPEHTFVSTWCRSTHRFAVHLAHGVAGSSSTNAKPPRFNWNVSPFISEWLQGLLWQSCVQSSVLLSWVSKAVCTLCVNDRHLQCYCKASWLQSLGSCQAVGQGRFLSCCFQQCSTDLSCQGPSLWDSHKIKDVEREDLKGLSQPKLISVSLSWASAPHIPPWHSSSVSALSQEGCCWREDKEESPSLTCSSCCSQETCWERCWLSRCCWGPRFCAECVWILEDQKNIFISRKCKLDYFAHFGSFLLICHVTPNAVWLPFDLGPVAACVHSQLWPSGRAQWERA